MRAVLAFLVLAVGLFPRIPPAPKPAPPNEGAVRAVMNEYATRWSRGNAAQLASLWTEQGDVVSLGSGAGTRGRAAIEKMWSELFSRRSPKVTWSLTSETESVRFITPHVAVVDGVFAYGGTQAPREGFTAVMSDEPGTWLIAALRVTPRGAAQR